jgi:Carboxypeptidase regulatory-like domain/TonB dependent receptor
MSFSNGTRHLSVCSLALFLALVLAFAPTASGQAITATLSGRVLDTSGGSIAKATVTATNKATGFSRSATASDSGEYSIPSLPAGDYDVAVEFTGFGKQTKAVTLQIGQVAALDFTLTPGQVEQKVTVEATSELVEPTRTEVSTVITERQITNLPVNGREFIDFALLSPAVTIGDTTSGNTDVIVEPVTKLSFAGQNIHFNFIAVDGADDISTASGIQRGTPPQESVQEFRVINTDYSAEFGRATAGIVNIITRSGTNEWHGVAYDYFRNNKLDAVNLLQATGAHVLRQNQFGLAIGGPIIKDKTFIYGNYEGQRRGESPFYNSAVLANINFINQVKTQVYGLPAEPNLGSVLRTNDTDNGFARVDHRFTDNENLFVRYFVNDGRLLNQSPLNDGFDLPSAFKNNFYRDQSIAGTLASVFSPKLINELRVQFARRSFDFPTVSTQPHLELSNIFTIGVNRGNPDFYRESRFEIVDNLTRSFDRHTLSFGGDSNYVRTTESFPLFYPFEADFPNLGAFLGNDGANGANCVSPVGDPGGPGPAGCQHPNVIFFERFQAPNFNEPTINTSVFQGGAISQNIRNAAEGQLNHTYDGLFVQDKWRATSRLTLNAGLRWEWETWPSGVLNTQWKNFDPRVGLAYSVGTKKNIVIRAGFGLFHGIIPAPLLACQEPSCGGVIGKYPGRPFENSLNAKTELFAFASAPGITGMALNDLITTGTYTDAVPAGFCPGGTLSGCGFFGPSVVVRFDQNHQNPYGIQASLAVEFEPLPDTSVSISGLHIRGVHLGSFFNVNQPDPQNATICAGANAPLCVFHDSAGQSAVKNLYCSVAVACPFTPGVRTFPIAIYFEATSRWDSQYDGLLLNVNKRLTHHFSVGASYTYSKSIDDGPNPSFVLIPQDSKNFRGERSDSSDDVRHRFVVNGTVTTPKEWNIFARDYSFGLIATLQSPMRFSKFAGFDANGDIFGNNDRVGIEPRNTFIGDNFRSVDIRAGRTFRFGEKRNLELLAEAFNLFNTTNIRFFNTVYGAADFCPFNPTAFGCPATPSGLREGSPNPLYGTPRAVFNPRQIQLALKFNF